MSESDKTQIIKMFKWGAITAEVQKNFKKYTKMQLAAIKAHITIGSYKGKKDHSINGIEKKEIVRLAKKGLDSKQILKKTSFNLKPQQVAAIIAWTTRGQI